MQKRLRELVDGGEIHGYIFGEEWSKTSEMTWRLVQAKPELRKDADLGRGNRGIMIVIL